MATKIKSSFGFGWGGKGPTPQKGLVRPAPVKGLVRPGDPNPQGLPVGAAPAAPASSPLPWDANYESTVGGITRNQAATNAALDQQETAAKQSYGFDDASNPFSRIAMLKEAFANSQRGNTNSAAASGQLYAGSLVNAQAASQHGFDVNQDSLRRDYDNTLNDIAARRTAANNTATDDTAAANWDRIQSGLAARPDPATLPAAPAANAHGAPTVTAGKDSKGNPGEWHTYPDGRKVFVRK